MVFILGLLTIGLLSSPVLGDEPVPLYKQVPFDRLTLNAQNENAVLDVQPLNLPDRRRPITPRTTGKLLVELTDVPGKTYEISWRAIEKVELFEHMVLTEARRLVEAGQLDEAYDYFEFLKTEHPQLPDLAPAFQDYLFEEAKRAYRQGQYDMALAMLRELHQRNPNRDGLERVIQAATDKLVAKYLAQQAYLPTQALIDNLAAWYPENTLVIQRRKEFDDRVASLLAAAQTASTSGDYRQADQLVRQLSAMAPKHREGKELAQSIHAHYRRMVVGVNYPLLVDHPNPASLADTTARRCGRLLYRMVTEFAAPGTDGGDYDCPLGQLDVTSFSPRLTLQLRPDQRWAEGDILLNDTVLTGADVARELLSMANPRSADYRPVWAALNPTIAVDDVYHAEVDFARPHVRPDALLQVRVCPYTIATAAERQTVSPPPNGPYVLESRSDTEAVFVANARYGLAGATQPSEIVERFFSEGGQAVRALRQGKFDLLARVMPWSIELLRSDRDVRVEPYGVPLIHCLIPNVKRPWTSRRDFRRALVYGIHREAILEQLLASQSLPGSQVVSGPFPAGRDHTDPLGYAYNEDVVARGYEPRLAMALVAVALKDEAKKTAADSSKASSDVAGPTLVLAHPAEELARVTCQSIRRQLELIGVKVELRPLTERLPRQVPEDVDLLYAELAVWEPAVDARTLLDIDGPSRGCSPYMSLALRQLDQATDWRDTRAVLRRIHRIAHDDVAIVPLWQMQHYLAYRRHVDAIAQQPPTLYYNVEQWNPGFVYPREP